MPKPNIEFTHSSSFPFTPSPSPASVPSVRVLSEDRDRADRTIILTHAPGQQWGGSGGQDSPAAHDYWEEIFILRGRLFDKTLQQWFSAESYSCRAPGMLHGPWMADPQLGCEELVIIRHAEPVSRPLANFHHPSSSIPTGATTTATSNNALSGSPVGVGSGSMAVFPDGPTRMKRRRDDRIVPMSERKRGPRTCRNCGGTRDRCELGPSKGPRMCTGAPIVDCDRPDCPYPGNCVVVASARGRQEPCAPRVAPAT